MCTNKERQQEIYDKYYLEYEHSVSRTHTMLKPYTIDVWKGRCIDKDILDLGCGNAYVLNQLQSSRVDFKSYTGIDISGEMVKNNIESFKHLKNVSFLVDNVETLEQLEDRRYDIVISFGCLHHLERPEEAIKSAYRKLRNDGELLGVEMNRRHPADSFVGFYSFILNLDADVVRHTLKKMIGIKPFKYKTRASKRNPYGENHPGHPGKRTPSEYREMLQSTGFGEIKIDCLYLDLLPYFLYRYNMALFRLMVAISKLFLIKRVENLTDVGSVVQIEAKK